MPTPDNPVPYLRLLGSPEEESARDIEARTVNFVQGRFLADGRTLNDPETAGAFTTTVGVVELVLDAALHAGAVDANGHETLRSWMTGLRNVPIILAREE